MLALAAEGASVVIDYVSDPAATDALESQLHDLGDAVTSVQADVSDVADLQKLVDTAVLGLRSARHHGQQRRDRDTHLGPRHHRDPVRPVCSTST